MLFRSWLDVSPFEILFGREPNLPIDNLLRRENWERTITTPEQHIKEAQRAMFQRVKEVRAERFERNKKAAGADKGIPEYKVGEKVYLKFPKGRFRPVGGSTKLAKVNDGPYTVRERLLDGLVYTVEHDVMGYTSNVSVTRMIPAGHLAIPADAADFPARWQQLRDGREDRMNDEKEGADEDSESEKNSDDEIDTRVPPVWRPMVDPRSILAPPLPETGSSDKKGQLEPFALRRPENVHLNIGTSSSASSSANSTATELVVGRERADVEERKERLGNASVEERKELLGNASVVDDAVAVQKPSADAAPQQGNERQTAAHVSAVGTSIAQQPQPIAQQADRSAQAQDSAAQAQGATAQSAQVTGHSARAQEALAQTAEQKADAQTSSGKVAPPTAASVGEAQTSTTPNEAKDATKRPRRTARAIELASDFTLHTQTKKSRVASKTKHNLSKLEQSSARKLERY